MKKLLYLVFPISLILWGCSEETMDKPEEPKQEQQDSNEEKVPEEGEENEDPQEPEEPENPEEGSQQDKPMEFRIHHIQVNTKGNAKIESKENYVECSVSMASDDPDWCFENVSAGIRGRGNSTWEWYDKKPYRIKFDKKQSVLGLGKAKSWVLLAEYRDPTDLMNAYVFELGHALGMPFTNHNRYVWLTLNGEEMGLYHLTEQVQQGENRVDVADEGGRLLSLDRDDGPDYSTEPDNFRSITYQMPVCVKHPENQTAAQLESIRDEFDKLERAIKSGTFPEAEAMLDMTSFVDFLIIQELVYNVELDAPRSMYIHKDKGGKWTMGPLWDFDGGFDFDWGSMYTGHRYFSNYRELVMGINPYTREGTYYNPPKFFTDLFRHPEFRSLYKSEWKRIKNLHESAWGATAQYVSDYWWELEQDLWPIGLQYSGQITAMRNWLNNRIVYMDSFIPKL